MKNLKQYYKELGKLVYAVAIADGTIQDEEREKLHEFVVKELASHEHSSDSSGMNKAFYVDFEFDTADQNKQDIHQCIVSFNHFLEINRERGDDELMRRSILLLEQVAKAYTHKREKDLIEIVKEKVGPLYHS